MVSVIEVEVYCMVGRLDAHTSPMLGHSAGINHVGLCGPHDLDLQLLCPHGDDLPKPVRFVPKRASYPIVPYASVYVRGERATSITPCITCCPGAYASAEGSLRLRLGHTHLLIIATLSVSGRLSASCMT
jgi:hypothetical protein